MFDQGLSGHTGATNDHLTLRDKEFLPVDVDGLNGEGCVFDDVAGKLFGLSEVNVRL